MKHWMKRSLALLLGLIMLCTLMPGFSARAEEIELIPIEDEPAGDIVLIDEDEPAAETEAVGNGTTTYRALLVGEVNFSWETANRNKGDVTRLKNMLGSVQGPNGGSYSVTCKYDLSVSGLKNAIKNTFSGADEDDVSLFFIATHGVTNIASGIYAGELVLIGSDGDEEYMTLGELATCLNAVPGKVIVFLGSCGSGAAIVSSGGKVSYVADNSGKSDKVFTEAVIRAFAEADELQPNTGELRSSKFYVLTAAAHQESSWGYEGSDPYNIFPYYIALGAGSGMPADANGNGTITLNELYNYVYTKALSVVDQHTQVYPSGSSYALFSKAGSALPTITTQPTNPTINAGDTLRITVKASNATSYQWYWRKSSSSSWSESTVSTAQKATLVYTNLSTSKNGYQYRCKVSNANGYVYTNTVTLTVKAGALPTITKQPTNPTINAGDTLRITVAASNATSYQWYWRKSSSSSWSESTVSTAQKATLVYTNLSTSKNGYQYRCKVSNSYGDVYTNTVTLTVKTGALPTITKQPTNPTINAGDTLRLTVEASNATSYQWYWRKSSSSSWSESTVSTAQKTTLVYTNLSASKNGYQYRCKVSNANGSVYTNTVTLTVKSVTYRALLVGEANFHSQTTLSYNPKNVSRMADMLGSVTGPKGGKYTVTTKTDLSKAALKSAISTAFAGADSDDVSLFYIASHGATRYSTGVYAGELVLIGSTYDEYLTIQELAECLNEVPGTVIVILNACGSGAAVYGNGDAASAEAADADFNDAVIRAFAELDDGGPNPNTGELRSSKFYVLTSSAHQESSYGNTTYGSFFTYYLCQGVTGSMPADANGNGTVTLSELHAYVYDKAIGPYYVTGDSSPHYQHAQVYPENSSYGLFK